MKRNQLIISMTMLLGILMFPLYIMSFYREQMGLFLIIYIVDRFITAYTANAFSTALNEFEELVNNVINEQQSKKILNFLFLMLSCMILVIVLYSYIFFTNVTLFILMISGEFIDKIIVIINNKKGLSK